MVTFNHDLYFEASEIRPVPLGAWDEPMALCEIGEWVPEPLLSVVSQHARSELAKLSPAISISRLAKIAHVGRGQVKRFLTGGRTRVSVVQAVFQPLGFSFGFLFDELMLIDLPERLVPEEASLQTEVKACRNAYRENHPAP